MQQNWHTEKLGVKRSKEKLIQCFNALKFMPNLLSLIVQIKSPVT